MQKLTCIFYLIVCSTAHLRAEQFEGMIVGGKFAEITNHPHSIFLNIDCVDEEHLDSWFCGGSIINQKIILTAGHCIDGCEIGGQIQARAGNAINNKGSVYKVDKFELHEGYNTRSLSNDIALLKTKKAIKFSNKVSRVALMMKPPYHEDATVAGWGVIDEKQDLTSPMLKFLAQKVWGYKDCLKTLKSLMNGTLCAAADSVLEHAAEGDSGSALVVRGFIQIGIVSYNMPWLDKHLMVYTDVGYYYKWIQFHSRALYCSS